MEMGLHYAFMKRWRNSSQELKNSSEKKGGGGDNKTLISDLHCFVPALGTSSVV